MTESSLHVLIPCSSEKTNLEQLGATDLFIMNSVELDEPRRRTFFNSQVRNSFHAFNYLRQENRETAQRCSAEE